MWWTILIQVLLFLLKLFLDRQERGERFTARENAKFAEADRLMIDLRRAAQKLGYNRTEGSRVAVVNRSGGAKKKRR